jgi:ankyrin repeat protein
MAPLPAHPNLDQLRHQAKDLLRAAKAGDVDALGEIRAVSDRITLDAAQLAVARSHGLASWPRLKEEVEARGLELAEKAAAFCVASINGRLGVAARLLAATPQIAGYGFLPAVILGDADRVAAELRREPGLAICPDSSSGWAPLHAACSSRWHQLEPDRADGLLAVVRLLLEAGADPLAATTGGRAHWTPLRCVIASANSGPSNVGVVELLLERGAIPNDHDLYLAGFAHDRSRLLPLLLDYVPDVHEIAEQALAAPISNDGVEAVRQLLEAGADPNRYRDDDGRPTPIVWAAIHADDSAELLDVLLTHRADPNAAGLDGYTPYRLATAAGRADLCEMLLRHDADDRLSEADRFLAACLHTDRVNAQRLLDNDPSLIAGLSGNERATVARAAERVTQVPSN